MVTHHSKPYNDKEKNMYDPPARELAIKILNGQGFPSVKENTDVFKVDLITDTNLVVEVWVRTKKHWKRDWKGKLILDYPTLAFPYRKYDWINKYGKDNIMFMVFSWDEDKFNKGQDPFEVFYTFMGDTVLKHGVLKVMHSSNNKYRDEFSYQVPVDKFNYHSVKEVLQ